MDIYLAACFTNQYMRGQKRYEKLTEYEQSIVHKIPNILESFHYVGAQKYVDDMRREGAKIFLDSGAFSAYTLGVALDLPGYCQYIQRNMDIIRVEDGTVMASVLDGIGDPLQTWHNQLWMESLGVRPLPCFHAGEDERYLEHYVRNYDYITLGGMVGTSNKQLMVWLDRIFDKYICDGSGRPRCKVHGFGITARDVMMRYPWYSVDSSSWIQAAAFGFIITPEWRNITVSDKSPLRHEAGAHAMTLTEVEQQVVLESLENAGFTLERLSTVYESRAAYNMWSFGVINAMINADGNREHFQLHNQELF